MNTNRPAADEPAVSGPQRQPTTFELYGPGTVVGPAPDAPGPGAAGSLRQTSYPTASTPEAWVRFYTVPAPVACGTYVLRAQTQGGDQNSWRLRVGLDNDADPTNAPPANYDNPDGVVGTNDELIIGLAQTSYQHNVTGGTCYTLYQYVAPNLASVAFHNFDFDGNLRIRYYAPSAAYDATAQSGGVVGTISGNAAWNGGTQTSRGTGDVIANPESGWWRIVSCMNPQNQFIQEGQRGAPTFYIQPPTPRVALTKDDTRTTIFPGNTLIYTIGFNNVADPAAPGAAVGLTLTDTLPANTTYVGCAITAPFTGTCARAGGVVTYAIDQTVDAGASGTVTLTLQVDAGAPAGPVANTVGAAYRDALGNGYVAQATDTDAIPARSSLAGSTYLDANNNGARDGGENGIAGVTITLTGTDDNGVPVNRTTATLADGSYTFDTLLPGTYTLTETQPGGYSDGLDTAGTAGGTAGNDTIGAIVLAPGTTATGYLFGERQLASPAPSPTPNPSASPTPTPSASPPATPRPSPTPTSRRARRPRPQSRSRPGSTWW